MPRPLVIALATVVAAFVLVAPASSSANTYCVNKPLCIGGTKAADPQSALTLAQLHLGADTVLIGPKATPYAGPFSYSGSDPVAIVGSGTGPGATILTAPSGVVPTLTLKHPESTVSNLRIEVVTGPGIGLDLEGTATGVRVQEREDDNEIGPPLGVFLAGGASFEGGSVAMAGGEGIASADPGNYAFVRESTVRSREGDGIWTRGKLSVTRSTIEAADVGIEVSSLDGAAELGDDVVRTDDGPALQVTYGATATARHMTMLADGDADRGVEVLAGGPGTGGPTNLTLISSIVSGYPMTLFRQGIDALNPGNATLRYSAWDGSTGQSGSGTTNLSTGNLPATTPSFVQRISLPPTIVSNLHLRAPSPLIDAADPAAPPLDHDGTPREQDGDGDGVNRSDIGAFEYVPPAASAPPPVTPTAGAVTGAVEDRVAPRLSRVSLSSHRLRLGSQLPKLIRGSRGTQIRFTLSEPAKVTLRFVPVEGQASKLAPLTLVVDGQAGGNRLRFAGRVAARRSLALGRHKLALTAIDAAGNRSPGRVVRQLELIP